MQNSIVNGVDIKTINIQYYIYLFVLVIAVTHVAMVQHQAITCCKELNSFALKKKAKHIPPYTKTVLTST